MYACLLRWQDAAPTERADLIPMDYNQYTTWSENSRLARIEYFDKKLTTKDFLRQIDMAHEAETGLVSVWPLLFIVYRGANLGGTILHGGSSLSKVSLKDTLHVL